MRYRECMQHRVALPRASPPLPHRARRMRSSVMRSRRSAANLASVVDQIEKYGWCSNSTSAAACMVQGRGQERELGHAGARLCLPALPLTGVREPQVEGPDGQLRARRWLELRRVRPRIGRGRVL